MPNNPLRGYQKHTNVLLGRVLGSLLYPRGGCLATIEGTSFFFTYFLTCVNQMPNNNTSGLTGNNSTRTTSPYSRLTKADLIGILHGTTSNPLSVAHFYRCAASIVFRWCDNVITGGFASVHSVKDQLSSLEKLYKNR